MCRLQRHIDQKKNAHQQQQHSKLAETFQLKYLECSRLIQDCTHGNRWHLQPHNYKIGQAFCVGDGPYPFTIRIRSNQHIQSIWVMSTKTFCLKFGHCCACLLKVPNGACKFGSGFLLMSNILSLHRLNVYCHLAFCFHIFKNNTIKTNTKQPILPFYLRQIDVFTDAKVDSRFSPVLRTNASI